MALRIKRLTCRVIVKTGGKKPLLHRDEKPDRPALAFALPMAQPKSEGRVEPSQTATEERDAAAGAKTSVAPGQADARAVADRVYDLMKQEIYLAQLRGGKQWRN